MSVVLKSVFETFRNRNLMVITLTQSLFMFVASLWWPYWSLYIMELGASPTLLGLIFMAEMTAQLIFQIPGGFLTDRFGRKKVIVIGSIFRALSPFIYVLTGSWQFVIVGMVITQASNMMIPAIDALIAESVSKENRGLGYGAFRMMTWLPQIFTAYLGGVITDMLGVVPGVKLAIAATAVVAVINVFIRWKYLEDTYVPGVEIHSKRVNPLEALRNIRTVPRQIWYLILVAGFSAFAFRVAGQFMVVYATRVIGLSKTEWGIVTTVVMVISTLLTIPGSIISDRIGRKPGIMVSLGLLPLQFLGLTLAGSFGGVMGARVLGGVSEGFGGAVTGIEGGSAWLALVADITPAGQRGMMMGIIGTVAGLLSLPGSSIGGYLYDSVSPQIPFYAAAASGFAAFLAFTILIKEPKSKAD
jgi:MFS family permease